MSTTSAYAGWERRREREQAVECNIAPDLLPLWRRVKGKIKGADPHARFEAFQEYAAEHEHEAIEALACEAEARFDVLLTARVEDEARAAADLAADRLAAGAVQVRPGLWSLDAMALVDLALAVGRGESIALVPAELCDPWDLGTELAPVVVPTRAILDAARVTNPQGWIVDLTADALTIEVEGSPTGYRLRASSPTEAAGRTWVAMPADEPIYAEAYDVAAE